MVSRIVFVGGPRGVGKTTLMTKASKGMEKHVRVMDLGPYYRRQAKRMFGKENEQLTPREFSLVSKSVEGQVRRTRKPVVVAGISYAIHSLQGMEADERVVPHIHSDLIDLARHLVFVHAPIKQIHARRLASPKDRPKTELDVNRDYISQRLVGRAQSHEYKLPFTIIDNSNGRLPKAVNALKRIIRRQVALDKRAR